MSGESPATILYDDKGQHPIGVIHDGIVYRLQVEATLNTGTLQNPLITSSTEIRNKTLYDIGATEIYIGYASQGIITSQNSWTIKKILLDSMTGNPISTLWSSSSAIWDNRTSENYS